MTVTDNADDQTVTFDFNPMVSPHREDPHIFFRAARARPAALSPTIGAYMISRYADVMTALHDPDTFSSTETLPLLYDNPPEVVAELRAGGVPQTGFVVNEDEPEHRHSRALFDAAVSGRRIRSLLPLMQQRADELIDGFTGGAAEIVSQYASPYIETIVNTLVGFPADDAEQVEAWTSDVLVLMNPMAPVDVKIAAARGVGDYTRYLQALIDDRRAHPRDDMISVLVHGADGFAGLTDDYVHSIARGTGRIGGFDTTRDLITATVLLTLQNPAVRDGIADDPTRTITKVTEETLRRDGPSRGLLRTATRDVELGGTLIPRGARLFLMFGSANRDETVFPDPDSVVLDRPNTHEHVAFGKGLHVCAGAPLARAETRIALQTLFTRLPGLTLAEDYQPDYTADFYFRSLASLHVRW
jgi:cytochrome P450